jgi:hypothetical protein
VESLTDEELDDLIAHLQGVPPIDGAHVKRLEALAVRVGWSPEVICEVFKSTSTPPGD